MDPNANATPDQVSTPPAPPPAELSSDELKERLDQIRKGPEVQKDTRTAALPTGTTEAKPDEKPPEQPKPEDQLREAQKFNGRLTNELGLARSEVARLTKENLALQAKLQTKPPADDPDRAAKNQKFIEDPLGALDEELEKREKLKEEQNKANQEEFKTNYQTVTTALPDTNIDELMPMMFAVALEDGVPEDVVMEFAKNPWKHDPRSVIALAKRALAEQKLREWDKPPAKPEKETKTGKPFTTLTASSGQSGRDTSPKLTREQLAELSDEELKEYKRQLTKKP